MDRSLGPPVSLTAQGQRNAGPGEVPLSLSHSRLSVSVGREPSGLVGAGQKDTPLTWAPSQQQLQAQVRGSGLVTHRTFSTPPRPSHSHPYSHRCHQAGTGTGWAVRPSHSSLWGSGLPQQRPQPRSSGQAVALRMDAGGCGAWLASAPPGAGAGAKMAQAAPTLARSRPAARGRCRRGRPSAPWRPGRRCPRNRAEPTRQAGGVGID